MGGFLGRLFERSFGLMPVVRPLAASYYAPGPPIEPAAPMSEEEVETIAWPSAPRPAASPLPPATPWPAEAAPPGGETTAVLGQDQAAPLPRAAVAPQAEAWPGPPVQEPAPLATPATPLSQLDAGHQPTPPEEPTERPWPRGSQREESWPDTASARAARSEPPLATPVATRPAPAPDPAPQALTSDSANLVDGVEVTTASPPAQPLSAARLQPAARLADPAGPAAERPWPGHQRSGSGEATEMRATLQAERTPGRWPPRGAEQRPSQAGAWGDAAEAAPPRVQPVRPSPPAAGVMRREAARAPREPAAPVVRVTIGRIEVRAVSAPEVPAARRETALQAPALSLEDYLKQRNGG